MNNNCKQINSKLNIDITSFYEKLVHEVTPYMKQIVEDSKLSSIFILDSKELIDINIHFQKLEYINKNYFSFSKPSESLFYFVNINDRESKIFGRDDLLGIFEAYDSLKQMLEYHLGLLEDFKNFKPKIPFCFWRLKTLEKRLDLLLKHYKSGIISKSEFLSQKALYEHLEDPYFDGEGFHKV